MKVTIVPVDSEATVTIHGLDDDSVMALIDALQDPDVSVLPISLDDVAMTYIRKDAIIRIDVESTEPTP